MTRATGRSEPPKPLSKEQKHARKERREAEARVATAANAKAAEAFARNRERLRAERLAREAGEGTDEARVERKSQMTGVDRNPSPRDPGVGLSLKSRPRHCRIINFLTGLKDRHS